jgi:SOS-response transcriptional repressor LexA
MIGTPRQRALYDFIKAYMAKNRFAPTRQQMADHLQTGRGNVQRMLEILERRGYVYRVDQYARGLSLSDPGKCPHCYNPLGSAACRAAAAKPITYSTTARAA